MVVQWCSSICGAKSKTPHPKMTADCWRLPLQVLKGETVPSREARLVGSDGRAVVGAEALESLACLLLFWMIFWWFYMMIYYLYIDFCFWGDFLLVL